MLRAAVLPRAGPGGADRAGGREARAGAGRRPSRLGGMGRTSEGPREQSVGRAGFGKVGVFSLCGAPATAFVSTFVDVPQAGIGTYDGWLPETLSEEPVPHHLVDVLREVRPRRAVMTTYTFNPAFFEAAVLPAAFRPDGCQINVLVDVGTLAASTHGSYAQHIGSRYAVAPVRAQGGIFHPKIALLDGDDRQVLCVGSGNLTIPGLARQLECLDVIDLSVEPGVAVQLRSFLRALATLRRRDSPRASAMLAAAAAWIRSPDEHIEQAPGVYLIHTLVQSAAAQAANIIKQAGRRAKRLTVLAPFHSADGSAARSFKSMLGAATLRIGHLGVLPCSEDAYSGASFVVPRVREDVDQFHAKVFEIETDEDVLVMSGSVNATDQSLQGTKNVEVSIARWVARSPFTWRVVRPKQFAPTEQLIAPVPGWTIEAALIASERLEGMVSGRDVAHADVEWVLSTATEEVARDRTTLNEHGTLLVDLPLRIPPSHDALRVSISGSGGHPSTWVNDLRALKSAKHGVRLQAHSETTPEICSAYRYAADLLRRALQGDPIPVDRTIAGGAQNAQDDEAEDELFDYANWVHAGRARSAAKGNLSGRHGAFLAGILELLLPSKEHRKYPAVDEDLAQTEPDSDNDELPPTGRAPPNSASETEREPATPQAQAEREQLLTACVAIRQAFESRRDGIASAIALAVAVSAFELERAQMQFLSQDVAHAGAFDAHRVLVVWLDCLSRYDFHDDERAELLPIACAVAAAAASIPPRSGPADPHHAPLRGSIDRMAGRRLRDDEVLAHMKHGLREEMMLRLHPRFRDAAMKAAPELAQAPSLDELINRTLISPLKATDQEWLRPLASALLRHPAPTIMALTTPEVEAGGCPVCYRQFTDQERRDLRYQHWLQHVQPRLHVLIYPDDPIPFRQAVGGRQL